MVGSKDFDAQTSGDNSPMSITRCVDLSAARWLEQRDEDWRRLATRGPRCFDKHARLRILPDPCYPGQSENDVRVGPDALSETEQLGVVLAELAAYTDTPNDCYFYVWDGWPSFDRGDPLPKVPEPRLFRVPWSALRLHRMGYPAPGAVARRLRRTPSCIRVAGRSFMVCDKRRRSPFRLDRRTADAIDRLVTNLQIDIVVDDPNREPPYYD